MNRVESLLERAQLEFGLYSEKLSLGRWNDYYIDFPVRLTSESLPPDRYNGKYDRIFNAPQFLSGISTDSAIVDPGDLEVGRRAFSVVVGEYGLGKTELLFRTAELLAEEGSARGRNCLPLRLGSCSAADRETLFTPGVDQDLFLPALFNHLASEEDRDLEHELLPELRSGRVVLILDALDELLTDLGDHRTFLENLVRIFDDAIESPDFHVVLSVRIEYLNHVDPEAKVMGSCLRGHSGAQVNFLAMEFFDTSTVGDYIVSRTRQIDFARDLYRHRKLMEMLRRPLLLRILCDLLSDERSAEEVASLIPEIKKLESAAELLELFTERAAVDTRLTEDQNELLDPEDGSGIRPTHRFDNGRLAQESLEAFRQGRHHLDQKGIERVIGSASFEDPRDLLRAVHKCPFLGLKLVKASPKAKGGNIRAEFTHRVFSEFFITKGIVAELEELRSTEAQSGGKAHPAFTAFHDLVLNIDMHRFLRALTIAKAGKPFWYHETAMAYGLSSASDEEWTPRLSSAERTALDDLRKDLLDARSGLIEGAEKLKKLAEDFLDLAEKKRFPRCETGSLGPRTLPPRYLIPSFEATAVCLLEAGIGAASLVNRFSRLLEKELNRAVEVLADPIQGSQAFAITELLVERILDIGRRFEFEWIAGWTEDCLDSRLPIRSANGIRERIKNILREIEKICPAPVRSA